MRLGRGFIAAVLALAATALAAGGASAFASSSPVVGHVYVNDNTAGTNTIAAFDRHADGTLTPAAGSPFATGGERGPGVRRQRPVGVPVEHPNRVRASGVVVDIDVPHHRGRARGGRRRRDGHRRRSRRSGGKQDRA